MKIPKEPTDPIEIYGHRIHWEYNHMIKFIDHSTEGLGLQKKAVKRDYERAANKDPIYWQAIYEIRDEELNRFETNYATILRNSFFVGCYSLFESCLLNICLLLEKEKASSGAKKYKRQSDKSYVESCKIYLEQQMGLDLSNVTKEWNFIDDAREIRNLITHQNAQIASSTVAELKKSKSYKILSKIESFRINTKHRSFKLVDNVYLLDFCHQSRTFLREIVRRHLINSIS